MSIPEYNRDDDIYWAVRRAYCNVSNYTWPPFDDWDEEKIRKSVRYLDEAVEKMLHDVTFNKDKL